MLRLRAPARAAPSRHVASVAPSMHARPASRRCAAPSQMLERRPSPSPLLRSVASARRSFATAAKGNKDRPAESRVPLRESTGAPREFEELMNEEDLDKALAEENLQDRQAMEDMQAELLNQLSPEEIEDLNSGIDPLDAARGELKTPQELEAFEREVGSLDSGPIHDPGLEREILLRGIKNKGINDELLTKLGESLSGERGPNGELRGAMQEAPGQELPAQATGVLADAVNNLEKMSEPDMNSMLDRLQRTVAEDAIGFDKPSVYRWWSAIRTFAKEGSPERAEKELALCEAEHKGAAVPVEVFHDIIAAYLFRVERRAPNAAFRNAERRLLGKQSHELVTPDVTAALKRADELLRRVFALRLKPSQELCERVVDGIARHGRREDAEALQAEAEKAGFQLQSLGLIAAGIRDGQLKEAGRRAERLAKSGDKDAAFAAQAAFSSMVLAAAQRGQWDEALAHMESVGVSEQPTMYSVLIGRMVRAGEVARAEKLLAQREKQAPETLDAIPYLALACNALRQSDVEGARATTKRLTNVLGGSLPPLAYAPLMSSLMWTRDNGASTEARKAAAEWLGELERVPQEQRTINDPNMRGPSAKEVADMRSAVAKLQEEMPPALKNWLANPKAPLKPEEREWLTQATMRLSPDPAKASQTLFFAAMQARGEASRKKMAEKAAA